MYVSLFFRGYLVVSDGFPVPAVDGQEEAPILIDWVENSSNHVYTQLVSILHMGLLQKLKFSLRIFKEN